MPIVTSWLSNRTEVTVIWQIPAFLLISVTLLQGDASDANLTRAKIDAVLPKLEAYIQEVRAQTGVPGIAVAIVHADEAIYVKGFGIREVGKSDSITPDTVFQLASVSKPITSTILARLVGEGKITWDSLISELDPGFRLMEPWVTSQLTLRDLLCHRSGLADHAGDLLEDMGYGRAEILYRLRYLKPGSSFRSHYAYTNFGFTEAAVAAAKQTGMEWEDLAAKMLYEPLGMSATSSRFADYRDAANHATIHAPDGDKKWAPKFTRQPDAQSPAGGVSSSVVDLTKWMRLHLADGKFDGKQLIQAEALLETHNPQMIAGVNPETHRASLYGLGWNVAYDEQGRLMWNHSGAFFLGARTQVSLYPAGDLGIAVLTNSGPNGVPEAISQTFYDLLFVGKSTRDWLKLANQLFDAEVQAELGKLRDYSKLPQEVTPSLPLQAYVGNYENEYYGTIEVSVKDEKLVLHLGPERTPFYMRHHDRDLFVYLPAGENAAGPSGVTFVVGEDQAAERVIVENLDLEGQGTFSRKESDSADAK